MCSKIKPSLNCTEAVAGLAPPLAVWWNHTQFRVYVEGVESKLFVFYQGEKEKEEASQSVFDCRYDGSLRFRFLHWLEYCSLISFIRKINKKKQTN